MRVPRENTSLARSGQQTDQFQVVAIILDDFRFFIFAGIVSGREKDDDDDNNHPFIPATPDWPQERNGQQQG